jgi:hypothetical protein
MATPTLVTITGQLRDTPTTGDATVTIAFKSKQLLRHTDGTVIEPFKITAVANASGAVTIAVPATDDPAWTPQGWTYRVSIDPADGSSLPPFDVAIPYAAAGTGLTLGQILPAAASSNGTLFAGVGHTHPDLQAEIDAISSGGGGAVTSVAGKTGVVTLVKGDVGLGNVDNTSDVNKPVSTSQAAADALKFDKSGGPITGDLSVSGYTALHGGEFNGDLVVTGFTALQGISLGGDLVAPNLRVANYTQLDGQLVVAGPINVGASGLINVGADTNLYRTAADVLATDDSLNVGGNMRIFGGITVDGSVTGIDKTDVGLSNVNNTADTAKPVSTAQQTALNAKSGLPVETTYTTPGTFSYADPGAGCKYLDVTIISSGGGGGSGRRGAATTVRNGGGSGGGGGYTRLMIPYGVITFPVSLTLGAPGTGGAAIAVNDTNGNAGGNAVGANFGTYARAASAGGGAGGTNTTQTAAFGGSGMTFGQTGVISSATGGVPGNPASFPSGPTAGGAGGGITSADVASNGGSGGPGIANVTATAGVVGGATPATGASQPSGSAIPGNGGGGGAASITAAAQAGADAGLYGAGGGGGGASLNGNASGKGGDGAPGIIRVVAMF